MTNDEADDRYGSVNIADNDLSRSAGVKLSAVITFQAEWYYGRYRTEKVGHEIMIITRLSSKGACCRLASNDELHDMFQSIQFSNRPAVAFV